MKAKSGGFRRWCGGFAVALAGLGLACGRSQVELVAGAGPDSSGAGGTGTGGSGGVGAGGGSGAVAGMGAGAAGAAGSAGAPPQDCVGQSGVPMIARRIVRLSDTQVLAAVGDLFGSEFARGVGVDLDVTPLEYRSFPPLATGGTAIGDALFSQFDRIATTVKARVAANMASITGCSAAPDVECARDFVLGLAERAFRRPLSAEDRTALLGLESTLLVDGGSGADLVEFGVYAVLSAPQFLYRLELGAEGGGDAVVELTTYEIASLLSFFITDGPPDAELLAAAGARGLATPGEVASHVARLLASPAGRRNLEAATVAYFQLSAIPNIVIDPRSVPGLTPSAGLLASIFREGQLFIQNTLWSGPLSALLTSQRTWANELTATPIYGVAPPVILDADGFGPVDLAEPRAGLLTLSPFLAAKSRPEGTSVVARGLQINRAIACATNPPFPEDDPTLEEVLRQMANWSEREKADYRRSDPLCAGCHGQFDAYGLALDVFDSLGRYRTADLEGRPIDPSVVLPEIFGDMPISGPAEMARVLGESRAFHACLAMNFFNFALGDVTQGSASASSPNQPTASCAVQRLVDRHAATDRSFAALITEIAQSPELRLRWNQP